MHQEEEFLMSHDLLESPADLNEPVDPRDPFPYGWRYVLEIQADGSEKWTQVPLTLEDILHPQEEDFRVNIDPHTDDCTYLRIVFKAQLADTPGAVVLTDCRVAWDAEGEYGHGPDHAVIFNVRAIRLWGTFNVVHEGTKPSLMVEVTCPSTRSTDLVNKVDEYAEQGVPHYVIADARIKDGVRRITLIDNHLNPATGEYERRPLSEDGRVWLPEVNLWLGVEDGQLVCFDVNGKRKGTYTEIEKAAAELKQRLRELESQMKLRNGDHPNGN
jgi:Uma2 family endonuclease